jgi:hypothetical protein
MEGNNLEDLGADGRIILRWILNYLLLKKDSALSMQLIK